MITKHGHHDSNVLYLRELLSGAGTITLAPGNVRSIVGHDNLFTIMHTTLSRGCLYPPRRPPFETIIAPVLWVRVKSVDVKDHSSVRWHNHSFVTDSKRSRLAFSALYDAQERVVKSQCLELVCVSDGLVPAC
jgi:hypothetical protein